KEAAAAEASLALAAKDVDEKSRLAALDALGGIASPDGPGLDALRAALAGTEEGDSLQAASSLGKLGPRARAAASSIETAFLEGTPRVRAAAAEALVRVLDDPGKTVPLLVAALKDKETDVRRAAASSLGQVGPAAEEAAPALITLLEDFLCRRAAFEALRGIRPRSVEVLLKALDHRERFVSGYAAERLGELGADAAEAIPRLRALSKGGERRLQRTATEALAKIEAVVREF
ncbi:MAG TPA: HEAT repeat domain-containing protein, partial [Planctomycetota bacterium]|nr:HEAT repeat domain-containing protein [Planctomycetota bacterium]